MQSKIKLNHIFANKNNRSVTHDKRSVKKLSMCRSINILMSAYKKNRKGVFFKLL